MPARKDGRRPGIAGAGALSRRGLLGGSAALAGLALAGEALAAAGGRAAAATGSGTAPGSGRAATVAEDRARHAFDTRVAAARLQDGQPAARHATNGDEAELPGWIACYSKGLPHDARGEVDGAAYRLLLDAIASGRPADFERIPLGGFVKLANPQGGLALNLIGPDPARVELAPPPRFASAEQAAELVELYWQSLLRDVAFADYETHPLALRAAEDLSRLAGFRGPRTAAGRVTPATLFRGAGAANLAGPYVSQFLYKDIFLPPMWVPQKVRTAVAGMDFLVRPDDWLTVQNGAIAGVNRFDGQPRHLRNGRDLGEFVHRDFSYQGALDACLILQKIGALPNGGNPYKHSRTQSGFATFGAPYLFYLLAVVTQVALAAAWYQKWCVHRRLRPEEYAGRVEVHRAGRARYPIPEELLASAAVGEVASRHGAALLPQAYPEGCPLHPSYPAAHAVIAGAGVTVLKAFFDESYLVPNPVVPAPDGLALRPYAGPPLAIGGELDKLAWNIAMGRNFAGIHWRSDAAGGLDLGERVAVAVLREMKLTGNEVFAGFSLRRFDGSRMTV
ncbi:MAG TPA: vanadium-dependent haloperoxidase [Thermoanaerobaculia bacterium]|nr:vanadium-dependent haloperoxidase [Thermoanaerobaculia bacterium]